MSTYMKHTLLIILTLREHVTEFAIEHMLTSEHYIRISHFQLTQYQSEILSVAIFFWKTV